MARSPIRFLLLQVRNDHDPMRHHEVSCFARSFRTDERAIEVYDLLAGAPSVDELDQVDVVLLGGSGDYSVAEGGDWLPAALDAMRELYELGKPVFASCWGFQAMARAMGGEVVTDHARAEVGSIVLHLTAEGKRDPVFGPLGDTFPVQSGHQDIVTRLPPGAVLLASSDTIENEAFCFPDRPIYCTQFHPELDKAGLIARLTQYPDYVRLAGARDIDELEQMTLETDAAESVLPRFLEVVLP